MMYRTRSFALLLCTSLYNPLHQVYHLYTVHVKINIKVDFIIRFRWTRSDTHLERKKDKEEETVKDTAR